MPTKLKISNVLLIVAGMAIAIAATWFVRGGRGGRHRTVGSAGRPTAIPRNVYSLGSSSRDTLKCRYLPNAQLRQNGVHAADIINERMAALQQNPTDLRQLLALSVHNRNHPYETIYMESLQQVLQEGLIGYAPEGTCFDPAIGT